MTYVLRPAFNRVTTGGVGWRGHGRQARAVDFRAVDFVVVGAGITGGSVACSVASSGASVVVAEAGGAARGATGASAGMVRAYDPDPATARLAAASLLMYRDPSCWPGGEVPLREVGALTVDAPDRRPRLEAAARDLAARGIDAYVTAAADAVLGVRLDGGVALVEPGAGYVVAAAVTRLLLREAERRGAVVLVDSAVTALARRGRRVRVTTAGFDVDARAVVLALGGWATDPPAGLRWPVPVRTRAVQVCLLERPPDVPPHATFVDLRSGGYGMPRGENTSLVGAPLLVWGEKAGAPAPPSADHERRTRHLVRRNLPWVAQAGTPRLVRSMDGYSEDPGLLVHSGFPDVWCAPVWSGGGIRVAPAAGREIASRLLAAYGSPGSAGRCASGLPRGAAGRLGGNR